MFIHASVFSEQKILIFYIIVVPILLYIYHEFHFNCFIHVGACICHRHFGIVVV